MRLIVFALHGRGYEDSLDGLGLDELDYKVFIKTKTTRATVLAESLGTQVRQAVEQRAQQPAQRRREAGLLQRRRPQPELRQQHEGLQHTVAMDDGSGTEGGHAGGVSRGVRGALPFAAEVGEERVAAGGVFCEHFAG